jgi:hypothetical protein
MIQEGISRRNLLEVDSVSGTGEPEAIAHRRLLDLASKFWVFLQSCAVVPVPEGQPDRLGPASRVAASLFLGRTLVGAFRRHNPPPCLGKGRCKFENGDQPGVRLRKTK